MIPLGWDVLAAACAAVAIGALIQSVAGFGLGLLSGPALAALDPVLVPAPVLIVTVVLGSADFILGRLVQAIPP